MLLAFWNDKNYVKYTALSITITLFLGTNIWPFLSIYGVKEVGMEKVATAAATMTIMMVVRIALATPFGLLADKIGPKKLFPIWMLVACLANPAAKSVSCGAVHISG